MSVDSLIDGILQREGGFSDNPADRGGPTKFGVTERVARANGYIGDMRDLPESTARDIYRNRYWIGPNFFKVAPISLRIAEELLDTGINCGPETAVDMLQRSLNVLNAMGKKYADLVVTDHVDEPTLGALRAYLKERGAEGEVVMLKALNCLQGCRYIELAEKRETDETFTYGWLRARVTI